MAYLERETVTVAALRSGATEDARALSVQEFSGASLCRRAPEAPVVTDEITALRTDPEIQRELVTDHSLSYHPPPRRARRPAPVPEYYPPPQERLSQEPYSDVKLFEPHAAPGDLAEARPIPLTVPLPAYTQPLPADRGTPPMIPNLSPPSPWPTPAPFVQMPQAAVSPQSPQSPQFYLPPGYAKQALEQTYRGESTSTRFATISLVVIALVFLVAGSSALYTFVVKGQLQAAAAPPPAEAVASALQPVASVAAKAPGAKNGIPEVDVMYLPKAGAQPILTAPASAEAPVPPPAAASTSPKTAAAAKHHGSTRTRDAQGAAQGPRVDEDEDEAPPAKTAKNGRGKAGRAGVMVPPLPKWGAAKHYSDDDEPPVGGLFLDQRSLNGIRGLDKAFSAD